MKSIRSAPDRRIGNTAAEFERDLAGNLCYERGTTAESASAQDVYWTLAVTVRDRSYIDCHDKAVGPAWADETGGPGCRS